MREGGPFDLRTARQNASYCGKKKDAVYVSDTSKAMAKGIRVNKLASGLGVESKAILQKLSQDWLPAVRGRERIWSDCGSRFLFH
jgi:hypothetical protein